MPAIRAGTRKEDTLMIRRTLAGTLTALALVIAAPVVPAAEAHGAYCGHGQHWHRNRTAVVKKRFLRHLSGGRHKVAVRFDYHRRGVPTLRRVVVYRCH